MYSCVLINHDYGINIIRGINWLMCYNRNSDFALISGILTLIVTFHRTYLSPESAQESVVCRWFGGFVHCRYIYIIYHLSSRQNYPPQRMPAWCCWKWPNSDPGWYLKTRVLSAVPACVCLGAEGAGRGGKGWLGADRKAALISRN